MFYPILNFGHFQRVGEASHPGPPRLRILLGNEVPSTGDVSSTVAASPRALAPIAINDSSEDDGENGSVSSTMTVFTDEEDREPRFDVLPHIEFWPFWGPPSPLTHNVKNHGGGGADGEPRRIAGNEQKKTKKTTQDKKLQRKTLEAG